MTCLKPCSAQNPCPDCFATVVEVENAEFEIYKGFYKPETMKKVTRFRIRKHYSVYFKLYERLQQDREILALRRKEGQWGIMVEEDIYAKQYQGTAMRLEILSAYLGNRLPDWHTAPYLPTEEAERRNKMYKMK